MAQSAGSIDSLSKAMGDLDKSGSAALKGVGQAFKQMGGSAGAVTDEVRSRVDGAISTFVEFGATQDQVAKGFKLLGQASATGARGIAQTANVMRTLVDETEDADLALKNVSKAFDLAAATGMKAEDAGRALGQTLKGETDVLRKFDKQATEAADAIDKITDPTLRAQAATRALEAAMKRQNSTLAKARNQVQAFAAAQPGLTKALKLTGATAVASFGAITAGMSASVKSFLEGSAKMRKASAKAEKNFKDLSFQIGGIITRSLGLDKALENSAGVLGKIGDFVQKHRVGFAKVIKFFAKGAVQIATVAANIGLGVAMFATFIVEGIQELVRKGFGVVGDVMASIGDSINTLNRLAQARGFDTLIDPAIAQNLKDSARALQDVGSDPVSLPLTEKLVELQDAANSASDAVLDALGEEPDAARLSRKGKRGLGRRTDKGAKGTARPLFEQVKLTGARSVSSEEVVSSRLAITALIEDIKIADDVTKAYNGSLTEQMRIFSSYPDKVDDAQKAIDLFSGTEGLQGTGQIMTDFVQGAAASMVGALDQLAMSFMSGNASLAEFGRGLLASLGDLASKAGQALILLSTGVLNVEAGNFAGALAVGIGLVALGAAFKTFAAGSQGNRGAGGQTARALERFGRRLFERDDPGAGREVIINIDGRQMRGFVLDAVNQGVRARQVPALRRT